MFRATKSLSSIGILSLVFVGLTPLPSTHAATKYQITCKLGGSTTVAKPGGNTSGDIYWIDDNGNGINPGGTSIGAGNWSLSTPPNAKQARVVLYQDGYQKFLGCR